MSRCALCTSAVTTKKQAISCEGLCKKQFHLTCIGTSNDLLSFIKDVSGLSWKCTNCSDLQDIFDKEKLHDIFEKKLTNFFGELNHLFTSVKSDFLKKAEEKLAEFQFPEATPIPKAKPSYSSVLCNSAHPAIIVKPKVTQDNKLTKSDILQNINPVDTDININKIKHIKDGGLLLSCQSTEEISRFKQMAQEKLSSDYEIRELKGLHPRIRIVGLSEKMDPDTICKFIVKQNNDLFSAVSDCKIIKVWPTKKNPEIYQAILQLDISDYAKVINNGCLLIGLDICKVYEAIEILRCFKCNGYNHSKTHCKNNLSCPKCSLRHELNVCRVDKLKCINCSVLKEKSIDSNINFEHAAWDRENCHAYKMAILKLKSDLGYQ